MGTPRLSFFRYTLLCAVLFGLVLAGCALLLRSPWLTLVAGSTGALVLAVLFSRRVSESALCLERDLRFLPGETPSRDLPRELADLVAAIGFTGQRWESDLAAAQETGRKLEAVLDSMQDPVTALDAAGRVSWANQPMQQLMRESHGSVRTGYSLVQTLRAPEILECVQAALESRESVERRPVTVLPGRIFAVSAAPMPDGGAVIVMHDVTRIEQVERTQREFVANVSHELRTPLTSIQGFVEMLLEEGDEVSPTHQLFAQERRREFLEAILKSARRMGRLTDDLLALARVESGKRKLQPEPVDVGVLLEECVEAASGLLKDKRGVLAVAGVAPAVEVFADTDAILQVTMNLVENALIYGRSSSGAAPLDVSVDGAEAGPAAEEWAVIELSAMLVAGSSGGTPAVVEFRVRDFGAGIALEHQQRLFERFYRVDKARSRESGGTGLGLAIVHHLVEAHRGHIRVESELGRGSTFIFTLPCVPSPEAEGAEREADFSTDAPLPVPQTGDV